jgi:hypothetical protein
MEQTGRTEQEADRRTEDLTRESVPQYHLLAVVSTPMDLWTEVTARRKINHIAFGRLVNIGLILAARNPSLAQR